MGDHSDPDTILSAIFHGLQSSNPETRAKSAYDLRNQVLSAVTESSPDVAGAVWDTVNQGLFDLMHRQNTEGKLGGLLAMNYLLEIEGEETLDSRRNLYRFYNYVKHLLPDPDVNLMLLASQTLGKIVFAASKTATSHVPSAGGAFNESFMDHQVPAAINLIQQQDSPRYAGVLILKELAINSPTYFYAHIGMVFENILAPLRDQRLVVREAAAELLSACLEIVIDRERTSPYLYQVLKDAEDGCLIGQPEVVHASLLAYRALFIHGGMFMRDVFTTAVEKILHFRADRDPLIRKLVLTIIPSLASYDTQTFSDLYLKKTMAHLLDVLDRPVDRANAFIAIGHTAGVVKSEMKPFLDNTMDRIMQGLQAPKKRFGDTYTPIFHCIAMLAAAVGPALNKWLPDVLELMFKCGLSESLKDALVAVSTNIPPFLKFIQDRLLDLLSVILSGKHYKPVGAPLPARKSESLEQPLTATETSNDKDPRQIRLALSTLGTFDFSGHILNEFVRSCALPYLEEDNADIRREAAITCCRLFVRDPIFYSSSSHATQVISDVLNKLLTVAIADPDASIRKVVLLSLHQGFDKHLAQAENVRCLFIALNDEVYENRSAAVRLIGRMAKNNPAYVVPSLRKTLIQLLTELEYATAKRNREDCAALLTMLVNVTHNFMKPYALPILATLMLKANDSNPTVAASITMCLGELAVVAGEEALPYVPQLMEVIIAQLGDPSLIKRDAALHTLGQVCASTGYVIDPLLEHPELLQLLNRILRSETTSGMVQREVLKVLGTIGALDPYARQNRSSENSSEIAMTAVNLVTPSLSPSSDDYFQTVVMNALLEILKDPSLNTHHHTAIEAIMSIFKTQGLKCVAFLPRVIPAFAAVTRSSPARLQEFHLQQLAILVGIVKQHVRNHTVTVFGLVKELWDIASLQLPLVSLIEALGNALAADFKPLLPTVIPLFMRAFENETAPKRSQTLIKIFDALQTFGSILEEYLYLVIPVVVKTYERTDGSTILRRQAIHTINRLTRHVNFSDHASRIIHPLIRVFNTANNELRMAVMETLCSLVIQLGSDFAIFVPMINQSLIRTKMNHPRYESLITKLLNGERLQEDNILESILKENVRLPEFSAPAEANKLVINQTHLRQAWDVSRVFSASDWTEWMRRVRLEFMKESPSHALRACMSLVDAHPPLAKELFNAAFLSCWTELYDQTQDELINALEMALESRAAPTEIIHSILDLAEFMEHQDKPLPIDNVTLGDHAVRHEAYAKALHYKEQQYLNEESAPLLESLISINTRLLLHDAASGLVDVAHNKYDIQENEEWYEKLGQWQNALDSYNKNAGDHPSIESEIGRMKCLHALGEWDELSSHVNRCWDVASAQHKIAIAPMAAAAAWSRADWDAMDSYINTMKSDSPDRHFFKAILFVHQNNFPRAWQHIARTRDLLHPQLTAFVGDGYGRSYNIMVRAQLLSELEEIIQYKKAADSPSLQSSMRRMWMKRHAMLKGCTPDVDVWQRILQVRTLVVNPESEPDMWIKFANLCRSTNRMALAEKAIDSLHPFNTTGHNINVPPAVVYAQLKVMWANGDRENTIGFLRKFIGHLTQDLELENKGSETDPRVATAKQPRVTAVSRLLARCHYKHGEWQAELRPGWVSQQQYYDDLLNSYRHATHYDGQWYKAWHTWALANFDVISHRQDRQDRTNELPSKDLAAHAVQAITGFFRSISLRNSQALQDTLRLLTLWFEFGAHQDVSLAVNKGFSEVGIDTWLEVIPQASCAYHILILLTTPQIIARIQTPHTNVRQDIHRILLAVGSNHPQALVYPLVVASQSSSKSRQNAANDILNAMRQHSAAIVDQAEYVSSELIRVAILWHERWHEGLEEASRLYFTEKNADGMIAVLQPLHDLLEKGPETARETSFTQVFGRELREAREACRRYRTYGDSSELDKAWDIYYAVFKKVEKQLPQLSTLDLQYVSPWLLEARDLELAVPGTYRSGHPVISIQRFSPKLTVIASKQRPRRLCLTGSDGRDYQYVLKGHEDLRQDERVMQLFSLVNTLLSVDTKSFQRRLHIQRYPVIPLAPNAGLLGWVQDNDTLHVLVRDYRESRKVVLNIEYRMMIQMAPDYENLPLLQKIEVFEYAMENTTGQDLYRILWLKSNNSEHWLDRRATFTRSLAVSSMTGHILGLGDRHPSNLLIERKTGKVIQIDFGDCFEIAMHREKFPEKIPFRLTRMLTHAMEVSGIEGSFRISSEITMAVLRDNKESLMAVLEAFIYDPLVNWRLTQPSPDMRRTGSESRRVSELARVAVHPQGPTRKLKADENLIFSDAAGNPIAREVTNSKALSVYHRVQNKLTGRDFDPHTILTVKQQVDRLIQQATAMENLCQCFSGWCAFW
ncbi:Serine/threonine-protein kinase TOR [Mycena indigotica]|uniref:Serine/threonine-protein kinase TOR n=1 Tax=Mycena indigotica TaxID=2126181 RepID=A0A8H6T2T3_9AGAR|nr:Serine/threonine-protein kinase TOR [Mycena indigotica]KAF7309844.1 Serine/threonine-protein kinase TOR [Mycena indigotica]